MDDFLTLDELIADSERDVMLPERSAAAGRERKIRVRRIGRPEYLALLPPPPPGSHDWPQEDAAWEARERAWLDSLAPEAFLARRRAVQEITYAVVALAAVTPPLTVDQARRLGNDAVTVHDEVLVFSGLAKRKAPKTAPEGTETAATDRGADAP